MLYALAGSSFRDAISSLIVDGDIVSVVLAVYADAHSACASQAGGIQWPSKVIFSNGNIHKAKCAGFSTILAMPR